MTCAGGRGRSGSAWRTCRALLLVLACTAPGLAHAADVSELANIRDPVERAEAYAAAAFDAYTEHDYATAVALYREAYRASPSADIVFNLARIYDVGLGDRAQAVRYYRDYVAHPDAGVHRIDLAFERLARLEAREPDAKEEPPEASAEGQISEVAIVKGPAIAKGSGVANAPAVVAETPPADDFWTPLRVSAAVAGGAGLIGLGVGAGFGVAALADARSARADCDGDVCRTQRGIDATRSAGEHAGIATVCMALGGGLIAAGVTLMWWEASSGGRDETAHQGLAPIATSSELGLSWSGRW